MRKLIVTETVRYEFEAPASTPGDEASLKWLFAGTNAPWAEADFACVTERKFKLEEPGERVRTGPAKDVPEC
jgi:hypothetical protein